MNKERAIEDLKTLKDYFIEETNAEPMCLQEAIEALENQHEAEWDYLPDDDMFVCTYCKGEAVRNVYPYCMWCGAKIKNRAEYIRVGNNDKL